MFLLFSYHFQIRHLPFCNYVDSLIFQKAII